MKKLNLFLFAVVVATASMAQGTITLIVNQAPSFEANTTNGKLVFPEDFEKSWKVLFSHPGDFTPVCTSEILELARMQKEFEKLNVEFAIISTDNLETHHAWKQSMEDILKKEGKDITIDFPLIDDNKARISNRYGMLHAWDNKTRDVRGVFVVGPDNLVKSINFYPNNIGRNVVELKRLLVALQTSEQYNVLTPVNWEVGDDVLVPYQPLLKSDLTENMEDKEKYYKVGINLWYKKGSSELIPASATNE